jgi:hypothetical protein
MVIPSDVYSHTFLLSTRLEVCLMVADHPRRRHWVKPKHSLLSVLIRSQDLLRHHQVWFVNYFYLLLLPLSEELCMLRTLINTAHEWI